MRTLASVLTIKSRAAGKSEDDSSLSRTHSHPNGSPVRSSAKPRSHNLFSKAPKTPVDTAPLTPPPSRPALTPGSSASSDGSASLRTPDDDGMMTFPKPEQDEKKKWSNWFGRRKSSLKAVTDDLHHSGNVSIPPIDDQPRPPMHDSPNNSDDEEDDDDYGVADTATASSSRVVLSPATYAKASSNLRVILRNKLVATHDPPPLIDRTSSPFFPRSTARRRETPFHHTLESAMHTRRMLKRVERKSLTRNEHASIAAFGARLKPDDGRGGSKDEIRILKPFSTADEEDSMSYAGMRVCMHSRGLRFWALRPCFEERYVVYAPGEHGGDVVMKSVQGVGRGLGVPEIEISDHVLNLSAIDLDDASFERALVPSYPMPKSVVPVIKPSKLSTPKPPSVAVKTSNLPPLPRAILTPPSVKTAAPVVTTLPNPIGMKPESPKPIKTTLPDPPTTKRGVRFAGESDADESVPLGYAVASRKKKEEKEAFLRVEREKRERALEERRKEQRLFDEQQRAVRKVAEEEHRLRVEEEKRKREERARAKYAEEVAAARQRIESARSGVENAQSLREARLREKEPVYSRPAYDSDRRQASDYFGKPPESPSTGSGDSRPPSFPSSTEDIRRNSLAQSSRPSSLHESSVEDLRSKNRRQSSASEAVNNADNRRMSSSSRPMSVASTSRGTIPRSFSSPIIMPMAVPVPVPTMPYANMGMNMMYGGIPQQMPMHAPMWNMPLLPPAPPFMMQQFSGPSHSPGGSSHSKSRSNSRDSSPSRSRQSHSAPTSPGERPPSSSTHKSSAKNSSSSRPVGGGHSKQGSNDTTPRHPSSLAKEATTGDVKRPIRVASYTPPSRAQSGFQNLSRQSLYSQSNRGSSRDVPSKAYSQPRIK
ncbi:hypothetical protein SCHPADRAFT_936481 [Schizopora paradoxa]|uniref:Uncharacterized protein n=1 Tax=Schizopora paradoxa TaxID=27342 RepID=A0A0H2S106_9AGAM|nr:hypothetical protein SCHPADRAFT_936481 [Schizopora paradoxa]